MITLNLTKRPALLWSPVHNSPSVRTLVFRHLVPFPTFRSYAIDYTSVALYFNSVPLSRPNRIGLVRFLAAFFRIVFLSGFSVDFALVRLRLQINFISFDLSAAISGH